MPQEKKEHCQKCKRILTTDEIGATKKPLMWTGRRSRGRSYPLKRWAVPSSCDRGEDEEADIGVGIR